MQFLTIFRVRGKGKLSYRHISTTIAVVTLTSVSNTSATTLNFTNNAGAGSAVWNVGANWNPTGPPTDVDTAIIPSGVTNLSGSLYITSGSGSASVAARHLIVTASAGEFANLRPSSSSGANTTLTFGTGTLGGSMVFDRGTTLAGIRIGQHGSFGAGTLTLNVPYSLGIVAKDSTIGGAYVDLTAS